MLDMTQKNISTSPFKSSFKILIHFILNNPFMHINFLLIKTLIICYFDTSLAKQFGAYKINI